MLTTLILLSSSMTMGIILASNPATLSMWIILTAMSITCTLGFNLTNWWGLIIFLIYIGGMLVMFAYFVVIQPNQQLEVKKMLIATSMSTTIMILFLANTANKPLYNVSLAESLSPFSLLMPKASPILLIMAIVLFLALVAVIKVSKINQGPLRPFSTK